MPEAVCGAQCVVSELVL